jgi:2-keto-4-pentenoate hydratase/2-oxohepta-3-ene-1,7-dioic acid hydratase in catechol pathway
MRLVTFGVLGPTGLVRRLGAQLGEGFGKSIVDLNNAYAFYLASETDETLPREIANVRTPPDLIGWLRGGPRSREAAHLAVQFVERLWDTERKYSYADWGKLWYDRSEVRLLAPLPRPNSIRDFSIYEEHMTRAPGATGAKRPTWWRWPPYYKGNPDSVIGPEDPIPYPYYTKRLDLEPEVGIVVGKAGRNLTPEQAQEHIAGYTVFIDCSARDGNARETFGPAKRKDFCNVLGPCLVTPDEIDEGNLAVRVIVDGETWFDGNTGHLRNFTPAQLVAYASDHETIQPGDLLGTGTVGLGASMDTHRWPQVGQTVTIEIEGIGALTHPIVAGDHGNGITLHGMTGLLPAPPDAATTPD